MLSLEKLGFPVGSGLDPATLTAVTGWQNSLAPFRGRGYRRQAEVHFERQEQGPAASDRAALSGRLTVVGLDATHLNLPRDVGVACLGLLLLLHTERLGRINATIRTRVGQRVPFLSI